VREERGYFQCSLSRAKREIAEAAGTLLDDRDDLLHKKFRKIEYGLYEQLTALFAVVDRGEARHRSPSNSRQQPGLRQNLALAVT
jgi:hypothetical protein